MSLSFCRSCLFNEESSSLWFIVWKGSWFWLFTHFGAIKSPRQSRGFFIPPKCVKSQNQLPFYTMKINLIITSNEIPIQYYDHEIQYRKETLNYIGRKQWVLCFRGLLLRNQIFIACAADKYRKKKTSNMIICVAQFCTILHDNGKCKKTCSWFVFA